MESWHTGFNRQNDKEKRVTFSLLSVGKEYWMIKLQRDSGRQKERFQENIEEVKWIIKRFLIS